MWFEKFGQVVRLGSQDTRPSEPELARHEEELEEHIDDPCTCKGNIRALLRAIPSKDEFVDEHPRDAAVVESDRIPPSGQEVSPN